MSIELLPPSTKPVAVYRVQRNSCDCHPETCCCNPWAVHAPGGEKVDTFYSQSDAKNRASFCQLVGCHE